MRAAASPLGKKAAYHPLDASVDDAVFLFSFQGNKTKNVNSATPVHSVLKTNNKDSTLKFTYADRIDKESQIRSEFTQRL